uniref:Uncharacterized protein n=1 Tax=Takifugu rubripes TaxID=31033 RepID=A0A674MFQ4_TAKRU
MCRHQKENKDPYRHKLTYSSCNYTCLLHLPHSHSLCSKILLSLVSSALRLSPIDFAVPSLLLISIHVQIVLGISLLLLSLGNSKDRYHCTFTFLPDEPALSDCSSGFTVQLYTGLLLTERRSNSAVWERMLVYISSNSAVFSSALSLFEHYTL